jgi:hypothetical protein
MPFSSRLLAFVWVICLFCLCDFIVSRSGIVLVAALDQTKKESSGFARPRSQVVLRVENYRYESKRAGNANNYYNNNQEELKMVLLQEMHEESMSDGDDGDNSTETKLTYNTTITTTSIRYNPLRRLWARVWNRLDEMDRMIVTSTLPLAALISIVPIVAGADLFWVNQLGDALAVSAQSAANLVYQFSVRHRQQLTTTRLLQSFCRGLRRLFKCTILHSFGF